jgi:2-polyprenyl-3-methyl-5-hydroxy-6-metoxy-1,4-benzoquinol methylase
MEPTNRARQHYEALLGDVYEWYVAAHGSPFEHARAWLDRHDLWTGTRYLDLGAGFGMHVMPLVEAGKTVTAVDFDATLLTRLRALLDARGLDASLHRADLMDFVRDARPSWDVVLCLGDTLTHLAESADVRTLLERSAQLLAPEGRLALSYRDSTDFSATGVSRFIEVARDARRTMHCLLEPIDAEHLRVTDIVTDVLPEGPRTRISDYVKLRLSRDAVASWAREVGLTPFVEDTSRGLVTQIFGRSR